MTRGRVVYACDIGSTRGSKPNFAWVRLNPTKTYSRIQSHSSIEELIDSLEQDVHAACDVALGFEAPLFIPIPNNASDLSKGRVGDEDRPFSNQMGLAVTTLAIHQSAWILMKLHEFAAEKYIFTSNADAWPPASLAPNLFCWEAFVSGAAHSRTHGEDAATAAVYFCQNETNLPSVNAVSAENLFSLINAAAIWSGWISDTSYLHKPVLALRPTKPLPDDISVVAHR